MSKADRIRRLMETEGEAVKGNTRVYNEGRYRAVAAFEDYEQRKDEARQIKEDAIDRLPDLIAELRKSVEANGGTLYVAEDAADATEYVQSIVDDVGGERVVKSKSMTTEEIELNEVLEGIDVDVVETDLGEWIVQLAEESPSHLIGPAVHKSREGIATLINETFDLDDPPETAQELTMFAREYLAEKIKDADVGVTGANFITADSGSILLVTSEGNARRVVSATDVHVAIAGVEKVIPSVKDLQPFIELIGRSATGQELTAYLSLLTPPIDMPVVDFDDDKTPISELDRDRDFHLVLVDNGRFDMRDDDELRETLYCIRCSACLNSCANFQSVGGHAFGGETYTGGIGTGWEAGIEGIEVAGGFNDFCTGCTRCVNACPVRIDVPWINTVVRDRVNQGTEHRFDWLVEGLTPENEPAPIDKRLFGNFERLARVGSKTAPVSNWIARRMLARKLLERVIGIDSRRELPTFRRETLVDWAQTRDTRIPGAEHRVVLYPDLYTNHVQVERGIATIRTLQAMGIDVTIAESQESGRAPLSQGMVKTAKRQADAVAKQLAPAIAEGRDVVVIEPSDLAMFYRDYERLLPKKRFESLASSSYDALAYVDQVLEAGADDSALTHGNGREVAYHSHCQQRTLGLEAPTLRVLERLGYEVLTSYVECCGMAGSFGYKADYYELSMDVGELLREQFEAEEAIDRPVFASGTSCQEQLGALLERDARHPIELIAPQ